MSNQLDRQYQESLKELSESLIAIQKPILILDSIKWPQTIEKQFFQDKAEKLPARTETTIYATR